MEPQQLAYFYAIAASMVFSSASLVFAHFSKKLSSLWMAVFKALVCFVCLLVSVIVMGAWQEIDMSTVLALMLSGMLGLAIGDLFLLQAFARMGAGRTLILFGFQPFFLGVASYYLFGQSFSAYRLIAIFFFLICLFLFSLEKFKEHGKWEWIGLLAALLGVLFDNTGVILTRWSFEHQPHLEPLFANFVRCSGAIVFFVLFGPFLKVRLMAQLNKLNLKEKGLAVLAAIMGAYLSLMLYLTALRIGHLASLSAIGVFGPLFSTTLECIIDRRWPSTYLWLSLVSFLFGFSLILFF